MSSLIPWCAVGRIRRTGPDHPGECAGETACDGLQRLTPGTRVCQGPGYVVKLVVFHLRPSRRWSSSTRSPCCDHTALDVAEQQRLRHRSSMSLALKGEIA
jgi:hypothetical protein